MASWATSCHGLTPSSSPTLPRSSSMPWMVSMRGSLWAARGPRSGGAAQGVLCLEAADLRGGRLAEVVLARHRAPVCAGAQLAEDAEEQPLHAPDQQRLGRQRLAAHL